MFTTRISCRIFIVASILVSFVGCSQSSTPKPRISAPSEKQPSTAELSTLYDPSSLVETKTLRDLPSDLQSVLGVTQPIRLGSLTLVSRAILRT